VAPDAAQDGDVRPLAVFDVDGVLADVRHRLHHVERRPKDWDAFFAAALDDPPLTTGVALAQASAQDCDVVYVTGRPERCRADTLAWFARHGLPQGELRMRDDRDRRPARLAKPGLLCRLAAGRRVAVVVDDDAQVCDAYEAAGYRVLRADWMSAPPALEQAQEDEGRT
jgi:phosphoglycolate phosphatase-like HAD superfamily hydrolase